MGPEDLAAGDVLINQRHTGIVIKDPSTQSLTVIHVSSLFKGIVNSTLEDFVAECGGDGVEIFRTISTQLAEKAVTFASKTVKQGGIDYDWRRLMQANIFSDHLKEAEKQKQSDALALLHNTFMLSGLFRAIKFASRRDLHLLKSNDGYQHKRGLRCAYFLCLCFQIAGIEDLVEPIKSPDSINWVSNKHIDNKPLPELQQQIPQSIFARYRVYIEKPELVIENGQLLQVEGKVKARDKSKYPNSTLKCQSNKDIAHPVYKSTLSQCNRHKDLSHLESKEKLENRMTKAMMVDAKYCTARDLLALLKEDNQYWQPAGVLVLELNHKPRLN